MAEETSPAEDTRSVEDTSLSEKQPVLNRRELLNYAWLASLGVLLLNVGGIGFLFAMPRFKAGEFGGTFVLGPASGAPPVDSPPDNNPKGKFWLTRPEGGVLALYKVCTHLGCLYAWREQEGKFVCPCHGSQFEYDGTYIRGPAPRSLDRFVVQLVTPDGQVVAETDPETGAPLPVPPDAENVIVQVDTGRKISGQRHG
jgi:cytochrome b6-f complex iron-sulfur subunit